VSDSAIIVVSFKDIETSEVLRERLEKRCEALAEEFPETTHFEITLAPDGAGHTAHGHVTGRQTEVAAHTEAIDITQAANKLVDTLHKLLRKVHDKHRFAQRREAQIDSTRRRG
jgi:ribosomal subunit interface protein